MTTAEHITHDSSDTLCGLQCVPGNPWTALYAGQAIPAPGADCHWCLTCLHRHRALRPRVLDSERTATDAAINLAPREHALPDTPTHTDITRLLAQVQRDRDTPYWGTGARLQVLDGVESWLLSLRDWLPAPPAPSPRVHCPVRGCDWWAETGAEGSNTTAQHQHVRETHRP